ncbi:uncharacterized protein LOC113217825 isoform X2 [Frankliniella occidentalis]|uniref:Uncharacterized protein LOC113217825 isoform X2 n=1 Tax=Frankliniella occidentalis TaxID=133901 RepID=A0A9C6U4P1_FRAOC|nr:uncharacterized protein LOC113217825 isoform X2 [Frankliniella occidentalis]
MPSSENGTVDAAELKSAYEDFLTTTTAPADVALGFVACSGPETRKGLERAYRASAINGFGFKNGKYSGSALYSGLSLLEHSCLPNARVLPDGDSEGVLLIAARDIAAGEHVTINYNYGEEPLPTRSERWLRNARRGFVCRCELCEDPTERGTYFNAWYCTTCKSKDLQQCLVTLVGAFGWRCRVCKSSGPCVDPAVLELEKSFASLQASMMLHPDRTGKDTQRLWQRFIDAALWPKGPLHLTHHLVVKARAELLGLGRCPVREPATLEEAGYLVEHCKKLLDVVVSLYPPIHSFTCVVKMYLFLKLMEIGSHRHGLDGNQRTVNSDIEKLKEELPALLAEIRRSATEPHELMALETLELKFMREFSFLFF